MRAKVHYWLAPDAPSVEMIAADYVAQRFAPHWHLGFAVGVVNRNMQRFRADGRDWVVGPGDLILLNPGQVHDGSSLHPDGWSSRMAYIPEAAFFGLTGLSCVDDRSPLRFTTAVVNHPALAARVAEWHVASESPFAGRPVLSTAAILTDVGRLMRPMAGPASATDPSAVSFELSERLRRLSDAGPQALRDACAEFEAPRTTSWRRMRHQFGLSAQPLLTHLRLVHAKRMLSAGRPVLDTALDIGYHDQSHFTRQFAAAYGMTPAQFRRAQLRL